MKNKKGQSIGLMFLPIVIILSVVVWWQVYGLPEKQMEAIAKGEVCDEFVKYDNEYDCCKDCEDLNLKYFKYEFSSSLFGANIKNCYCEKNNTVTQVW